MPDIELYWPLKPATVIQVFGANPEYYAKFLDSSGNPQKGHPGLDFAARTGTPIYAAHDGQAIYLKDSHGGEGIWIYAKGYATIYWHLIGDTDPKYSIPIPFDNRSHSVKAGDHIGWSDNTGAPFESTGPHLHFGLVMTSDVSTVLNQGNGFNGCVDPAPHMNGLFAQDIPQLTSLYQKLISTLQALVGALKPKTN